MDLTYRPDLTAQTGTTSDQHYCHITYTVYLPQAISHTSAYSRHHL